KYDRQERLQLWDQNIIKNSTVLIAGIGGTGSEVAKNLSLLGIGHLILVDDDSIEFSNLNRQLIFSEEDVGKKKAIIAKERIQEGFNPDIEISGYANRLQNIPMRLFEETDIIAGCVDNFLARQFLNSITVELNKPLIDSATDGYFGQVQYIKPRLTACLACDNPLPPDETKVLTAPCTLVGIPRTKEHCAWKALYEFNKIHKRAPIDSSYEDIQDLRKMANEFAAKYKFGHFEEKELLQLILFHVPSLITVNAVISGIQSQEIVKTLFLEKKSIMKKNDQKTINKLINAKRFRISPFTIYSALTGTINTFDLVRDPDCLVCGQAGVPSDPVQVLRVDQKSPFKIILDTIGQKSQKQYAGFRDNSLLPEDIRIKDLLSDGDRITLSSLTDDEEIRLKIKFKT
ncbi:MAG: ThiF family adenylyltransferase, partial [Candidatus Hodarchaeota archaeon]